MGSKTIITTVALVAIAAIVAIRGAVAQEPSPESSIETVRNFYNGALYEDALSLLDRLGSVNTTLTHQVQLEKYRALCLLALGRTSEAEKTIEALLITDPSYRPVDNDTSPRVRATFQQMRKRLLPKLIPDLYAKARAQYDRKEFAQAAEGFQQLIVLIDDTNGDTAMADLRVVASGFLDLSHAAAAAARDGARRPDTPAAPSEAAAVTPKSAPDMVTPATIFSANDANVVPPVAIRQTLPTWQGPVRSIVFTLSGKLDVVIDQGGKVVSAKLIDPIHPLYDTALLDGARQWTYRPATLEGRPVKFLKTIEIVLTNK